MSVTLRGAPTTITQATTATSFVATCPAGTVTGDIILIGVSSAAGQSTPAGFTLLFQTVGSSCTNSLFGKIATGADVASVTTYTVAISLSKYGAAIFTLTGGNFTLDSISTPANVSTATTAVQYPATTVVNPGSLVLGFGAGRNAATNLTNNDFTTPAGWTELCDVWSTQASGGAVGNSGLQIISNTPGASGSIQPPASSLTNSSAQVLYVVSVSPVAVMAAYNNTTVAYELNRLAGTLGASGQVTCDAAKAANIWAGTTNLDLDGALAAKSGSSKGGAKGSANILAGTTNCDLVVALSQIVS